MKLYPSLVMFASVIVLAEAMLQNCQMLKCPVNKTLSSSVAYTVSTTEEYYEPKKRVTGRALLASYSSLIVEREVSLNNRVS